MKTYKTFQKGGHKVAVKQGWSWPAFFFTWIWAFTKKLIVAGIIGLVAEGIPAIAITLAENSGKSPRSNPALLIVGIVFALKGNKWREAQLLKSGYSFAGVVQAKNPAEAAASKL